ncbi:MAG: hypothetical protein A2Z91_06350 [Deltaproteobacteria bacterium GWA2_38_16]|nr:MAG: hypothetical protein A2Z91_06350 [Deltaproteobacteria bacterium GWA2_38_16]OGQ03679.1 MAG: hypothetical protein A3D19_02430 [Deltaproteobacteria bacterium RIFCSPHIGHO2_02_FULL_38_15]
MYKKILYCFFACILFVIFIEMLSYVTLSVYYKYFNAHGYSQFFWEKMKHNVHPLVSRYFFLDEKNIGENRINSNEVFQFDPIIGWIPVPGISYIGYLNGHKTVYQHNKNGFMSMDIEEIIPFKKAEDEYRIFVLGGSTVMGVGASDMRSTIPAYLETELKKKNTKNIRVINAGVGGFKAVQEYMYFIRKLIDYEPDLIITFDGSNDVGRAIDALRGNLKPSDDYYLAIQGYNMTQLLGSFKYFLERAKSSIQYNISTGKISFFCFGLSQFMSLVRSKNTRKSVPTSKEKINLKLDVIKFYTHYLEEIVLYGLSHRVKIFCILQPRINNGFKKNHPKEAVFYSIKDKQDKYDMHYVFSVFSSLFNDMEKKYSNNDTVLIKDYSAIFKNVSDEIYVDEIHYNDFGNLIIAQKIASDVQSYLKNEITRAQIIN